ncbi:M20 family peptidase [Variovorax terrae]|uniref:M20 family peptidase n=1 Tax=Variovorax terrae TaxID=2923278 RepID=A0A9X1VTY6_9BURK|nr:M20 family peptidase [Variovorax terrae]MCJ0763272.1 M20 family peptidase [Variovorax terrae]
MIKRIFLALVGVIVLLAAAVGLKTAMTPSRQLAIRPVTPVAVDEAAAASRLAAAVRLRTISDKDDAKANDAEFKKLHAHIEQSFPKVAATLKREVIGQNSLLYTWQGTDPAAKPIALMAHQDVVPIASGTEKMWKAEPFGGEIKDGFVWGRGAWDNKGNLFSQLEAIEMLIGSGFKPRQTVYLIMGDDEEVLGVRGAKVMAALLKSRGVKLDWIIDEGLLVTEGILKGLDPNAALIGVAEKGYGTYVLSLDTTPGHSSMPGKSSAIGMLSVALANLENKQMPAAIRGVAGEMFDAIAPEMNGLNRVVLSNLWLFRPLVQKQLENAPSTNAMLRTTTALTIVNAGNKDNVLPGHAEAVVNFRLLPGDTLAAVGDHVKQAVANDAITITQYPGNAEASPVAPTTSEGYQAINRTIRETFANTIVAPGLMVAATDSRYFSEVSDNIYKFSPVRATNEDLPRFHGTNERISVKNYAEMIRFYHQLLQNASRKDPS